MKVWRFLLLLSLVGLTACNHREANKTRELEVEEWVEGRPVIDVESLNKDFDLNMDISQLTLSELRVLRNAFAARQGYLFMSAELRSIFNQTSWYDSLMYARWEAEDNWQYYDRCTPEERKMYFGDKEPETPRPAKIQYSKEELAFIERVKKREKELLANNFRMDDGWLVRVDNIINSYQKEGMGWTTRELGGNHGVTMCSAPYAKGNQLRSKLAEQGFAITTGNYEQLFQVYEKNDYFNFPSFVTTDLYLQTFHLYFDVLLRKLEERHFGPLIGNFCRKMHWAMLQQSFDEQDEALKARAEHAVAYFAIACAQLDGELLLAVPAALKADVQAELQHISNSTDDVSDFLDYHDAFFAYSLFRPRGHYTRNENLSRYFRAMMWLQTAPFVLDNPAQLQELALIGETLAGKAELLEAYRQMTVPFDFLMGNPDNGSALQVYELMQQQQVSAKDLMHDQAKLKTLRKALEKQLDAQTRILPKQQVTAKHKLNLMPQRFMPDALTLQEMVDCESKTTLRGAPKGLDVMAAMGMGAAERILIDELDEAKSWKDFRPRLEKMKKENNPSTWTETVANEWMKALTTLQAPNYEQPKPEGLHADYFMRTQQWDKKNLNTALASWAELKHDAILYAKQPFAAECGGGGPEEPVVMAYVEPNVRFWQAAIDLLDKTSKVLDDCGLQTDETRRYSEALHEQAEFLLAVSKKELVGQRLSDEEYYQIEHIGASFEYLSLDLLREGDEWLSGWNDVQGTDRRIAVVADVYTANGLNNPKKSILYEAVGPVDEIYVVVEIGGNLYLTRGAVFSYREFHRPLDAQRMTDEEWQRTLEKHPEEGLPSWMKPLRITPNDVPADNELIFYSSGC